MFYLVNNVVRNNIYRVNRCHIQIEETARRKIQPMI